MLQVSEPNNIEVIKGNGLAVFIDANTNKITFKDSNGVIERFTSITGNVDGSGTPTYLPKWEDANTLNDSVINQDSNSNVFLNGTFSVKDEGSAFINFGKTTPLTNFLPSGNGIGIVYKTIGNNEEGVASYHLVNQNTSSSQLPNSGQPFFCY